MTAEETLAYIYSRLQREEAHVRHRLVEAMFGLSKDLEHKATLLQREAPRAALINGLGEVRSQGSRVDVLCARYDTVLDHYLQLAALIEDDRENDGRTMEL